MGQKAYLTVINQNARFRFEYQFLQLYQLMSQRELEDSQEVKSLLLLLDEAHFTGQKSAQITLERIGLAAKNLGRKDLKQREEIYNLQSELRQFQIRQRKSDKLHKKDQEILDQLRKQLTRVSQSNKFKVQKLLRKQSYDTQEQGHLKYRKSQRKRSVINETQCEIISTSTLEDLQNQNQFFVKKITNLQKLYEDEKNQNQASRLLIKELYLALERQDSDDEQRMSEEALSQSEKENDRSTLDADSEKGEDLPMPDWLASPKHRFDPAQFRLETDQAVGDAIASSSQGLLQFCWHKSNELYCAFFNKR